MADAVAAFPRGFYCEHTPSKVRVYALVDCAGGPEILVALVSLADPEMAGRVADVLNTALEATPGPVLQAEVEEVCQLLPAAPRASFTQALEHLRSGTWPVPSLRGRWPALDDEDEESDTPRRLSDQFARTPNGARLEEHPGPVLRLGRLLEMHVHDTQRVLHAARSRGWTPEPDDDLNEDDHLVGAVMWLTEDPVDIPGIDIVTEAETGEMLTAGEQEVADWSRVPVTLEFGTGWRLRDEPRKADGPRFDYAALYPVPACDHDGEQEPWCEECESFSISPRTAAVLATSLVILADECRMDIKAHGDNPVDPDDAWMRFDELPRITWRQDAAWRTRFAQAATDLLADVNSGRYPHPRCRGEEMALHLALNGAEAVVDLMNDSDEYRTTVVGGLPTHTADYDWDLCTDVLLEDTDILFLYDQSADGIEDPDVEINKHFGIGDMRPDAWFESLRGVPSRPSDGD